MAVNPQDIQKYVDTQKQYGLSESRIFDNVKKDFGVDLRQAGLTPQKEQYEKTITDNLMELAPTAGSIVGGVAGGMLGGVPGAVIGSGAGGALGETARQAYTPEDDWNARKIVEEGAWGAASELAGIGIGKLIGKGASYLGKAAMPKAAEKLATLNLGKQAVKTYAKETGGELGKDLMKFNLVRKTSLEAAALAAEKKAAYEAAVNASTKTIDPMKLVGKLLDQADAFLKSGNPDVIAKGKAFQDIAETTANHFINTPKVTPAQLLTEKRLVSDILSNTAFNEGVKKSVNATHELMLMDILNNAVPGIKEIGKDMQRLYSIEGVLKGAEQLASGGRSVPLVPIMAASGGAAAAGIPGGLAGYAAMTALNDPRTTQLATKGLVKAAPSVARAGEALSDLGSKSLANQLVRTGIGQTVGGVLKQADKIVDPESYEKQGTGAAPQDMTTTTPGESTSVIGQVSAEEPQKKGILKLMNWNEDKFLKMVMQYPNDPTLKKVYERYLLEQKETTKPKMSAAVAKYANSAMAAMQALNLLKSGGVKTGVGQDIIGGLGETFDLNSSKQQQYRSSLALARTQVRNALLGANMTPKELASIQAFIPEFTDGPKTAETKLRTFINLMNEFALNMQNAEPEPLVPESTAVQQ